jgi:hypothetical protein
MTYGSAAEVVVYDDVRAPALWRAADLCRKLGEVGIYDPLIYGAWPRDLCLEASALPYREPALIDVLVWGSDADALCHNGALRRAGVNVHEPNPHYDLIFDAHVRFLETFWVPGIAVAPVRFAVPAALLAADSVARGFEDCELQVAIYRARRYATRAFSAYLEHMQQELWHPERPAATLAA